MTEPRRHKRAWAGPTLDDFERIARELVIADRLLKDAVLDLANAVRLCPAAGMTDLGSDRLWLIRQDAVVQLAEDAHQRAKEYRARCGDAFLDAARWHPNQLHKLDVFR